jgi:3-oxoacyl-[acyl-carrier-protein] synthase II
MNRISIIGIGWINGMEYGCVIKNQRTPYQDRSILKKEILSMSCSNFGRIDNASKMTCYAGALSLEDAGIAFSHDLKQDIGLIGTNNKGSLETDVNYFKDYLKTNRTSSRGNLFIYTLPTSPLGEAAIRFGLQGPLLYIAASENSLISVIETAAEMILFDESPVMLAGMSREDEAVYFVLKRDCEAGQRVLCNVEQAVEVLRKAPAFDEMIKEFAVFRKGNGPQ